MIREIATISLLIATAQGAENDAELFLQIRKESAAIKAAYDELKRDSSPTFNAFQKQLADGESTTDDVQKHYDNVQAKLDILQKLRTRIDLWNERVDAVNAIVDAKQSKIADAASRKAALAELEANKRTISTTLSNKDRASLVTASDGTLALVNSNELGIETKVSREDRATARAKANLQKDEIQAAAAEEYASAELERLEKVDCSVTMAQLQALVKNEKTKCRYLVKKAK